MVQRRNLAGVLLLALLLPILAACGGTGGNAGNTTTGSAAASAGTTGGTTGGAATTATTDAGAATTATTGAGAATTATTGAGAATTATTGAAGADTEATTTAGTDATTTAGTEGTATAGAGPGPSTGRPSVEPETIGPELANAYNGQYQGTKVTMMGPFVGPDQEAFESAIQPFEELTGIDVVYEGTKEFESIINVRVESGTPPDIADIPQPGLMASFAQAGRVQDVSKWFADGWLQQQYNQGYLDTATVAGQNGDILGGVFQRVNTKSLVWYPKDDWDEAGYEIPQTWEEMTTLMDNIVADGDTPWCIGIESGTATGWPATDWLEEIMLRTTSLENYDRWTTGELEFTSPEVRNAAERMAEIWLNDQYVYGGRQQIVSTSFGDSVQPMFEDPPRCWLHKQGNFITSFFPDEAQAGQDYDFFYFPPIDEQYGSPVLFAGDLMTAFNDRPEVRAVMQYFTTFDSLKGWVATGGALSPHNDVDLSAYGSDVERKVQEVLANADSVRFDGSDLMPGAVGAGTFWTGMTDWISGSADLDQALQTAQSGWSNVQR